MSPSHDSRTVDGVVAPPVIVAPKLKRPSKPADWFPVLAGLLVSLMLVGMLGLDLWTLAIAAGVFYLSRRYRDPQQRSIDSMRLNAYGARLREELSRESKRPQFWPIVLGAAVVQLWIWSNVGTPVGFWRAVWLLLSA